MIYEFLSYATILKYPANYYCSSLYFKRNKRKNICVIIKILYK